MNPFAIDFIKNSIIKIILKIMSIISKALMAYRKWGSVDFLSEFMYVSIKSLIDYKTIILKIM